MKILQAIDFRRKRVAPAKAIRTGEHLFNLQLWCWGRDVKHRTGNLLVRNGLRRRPVPEGIASTSAYHRPMGGGKHLILWGWGLFLSQERIGSIFLRRYEFSPYFSRNDSALHDCWSPEEIPGLFQPTSPGDVAAARTLLAEAMTWVTRYESGVIRKNGIGYRRECVCRWKETVGARFRFDVPDGNLAERWRTLIAEVDAA